MHGKLRILVAAWLALLAAGMFRGCDPTSTPITSSLLSDSTSSTTGTPDTFPKDGRVITILHTNDVRGEVDPCGWGIPRGGLARRASAIDGIRKEMRREPVFLLDAGNALTGHWLSQASQGALQRDAMEMMGYDAMTVGGQDLSLGVDGLRSLTKEATFSVLSANLVEPETGLPVFTPYVVIQRAGIRLGVLGLTEDTALSDAPDGQDYEILPYPITVSAYLEDLAVQSDIVVVLSHVGLQDDKLLAERFDAIDAIIGGRNARRMLAPEVIDGTPVVQLDARGEDLGVLQIALDDGVRVAHRWHILGLGPEFDDHAEMLDLVNRYREALDAAIVGSTQEPES